VLWQSLLAAVKCPGVRSGRLLVPVGRQAPPASTEALAALVATRAGRNRNDLALFVPPLAFIPQLIP